MSDPQTHRTLINGAEGRRAVTSPEGGVETHLFPVLTNIRTYINIGLLKYSLSVFVLVNTVISILKTGTRPEHSLQDLKNGTLGF